MSMKICKMDKFIIAIVIACVAFVFSGCNEETSRQISGCNEETSRQMEFSNSTVTKESVKSQRVNAKTDTNSNWYRRGKPIPGFNEERKTTFFHCDSPVMSCFPDNPPVKNMYKGHVKIPSLSDIKVKNENGANRFASDIMKIIRQRTSGLHFVYDKYLKKPGFHGKITLKFTIAPEGKITDVSIVSSTTQNNKFDAEIQQLVGSWVFHRVKSGETTVTIPFTFFEWNLLANFVNDIQRS